VGIWGIGRREGRRELRIATDEPSLANLTYSPFAYGDVTCYLTGTNAGMMAASHTDYTTTPYIQPQYDNKTAASSSSLHYHLHLNSILITTQDLTLCVIVGREKDSCRELDASICVC